MYFFKNDLYLVIEPLEFGNSNFIKQKKSQIKAHFLAFPERSTTSPLAVMDKMDVLQK